MREGTITRAIEFATTAHGEQKRKYTGEAYVTHPIAVAQLMLEHGAEVIQEQLVAAVLHDVVEDTEVTIEEVRREFGELVAEYVGWVTDVSKPGDGNRATRKKLDREHVAKAPSAAQTIKLADLIHNTETIVHYAPQFATIYMQEKQMLLAVLQDGDVELHKIATAMVEDYFAAEG